MKIFYTGSVSVWPSRTPRTGYILDGFPRDLAQAGWDDQARAAGRRFRRSSNGYCGGSIDRAPVRAVGLPGDGESYHVVHRPPRVPGLCDHDGAALVRRPDDEPAAIRHRLEIYQTVTLPLRDYYRAQGLLDRGRRRRPEAVTQRIISALQDLKNAAFEV